jgi:hypothetical protein
VNEEPQPISIVFEEDMPFERIAEFIQVLSELYGEDLDVVSVNHIPPLPRFKEVV